MNVLVLSTIPRGHFKNCDKLNSAPIKPKVHEYKTRANTLQEAGAFFFVKKQEPNRDMCQQTSSKFASGSVRRRKQKKQPLAPAFSCLLPSPTLNLHTRNFHNLHNTNLEVAADSLAHGSPALCVVVCRTTGGGRGGSYWAHLWNISFT